MKSLLVKSLGTILISATAVLSLSACAPTINEDMLLDKADYWQRRDTTSSIYTRGPKAQQMLNKDISQCVTELRELERLGALRHRIPATAPVDPDSPEGALAEWETPMRDGSLRVEHQPYHDFESCMVYKGWERVKHLPYDIAEEARDTYLETIGEDGQRTENRRRTKARQAEENWDNLNQ